ncbi:MAG: polyphosphate kinase 1 [Ignavibacteriae bacterium HGW-Ignavibacteriae-1]|jgi:polyphosphate kinase|nr:MAG: polyphosphate kinase 1 [Ignavibacteriae bacterium HGW-Ignavibacteriae-1]
MFATNDEPIIENNEIEKQRALNSKKKLTSHSFYFNRELSLIEFQRRVLSEAEDKRHPLLERLKFCCILSSNLDEFFMIRVAGLKSQVAGDVVELSYDGMTPENQLKEIRKQLLPIYKKQENILNEQIFPELEKNDIYFHRIENLNSEEYSFIENYFNDEILPLLTPLSLGPANPFPRLINRSLNIAFLLNEISEEVTENHIAFIQVPSVLTRFVKIPRESGFHIVLIEHVIKAFADVLFPGFEILMANTFRVTRDADIEIAEDEADDLLSEIAEQIRLRNWGKAVVRLEVNSKMPDYLANLLMKALDIEPSDVYVHARPLNLVDFMEMIKYDLRHLKDTPFASRKIPEFMIEDVSLFDAIKNQDIMVHHPFDTFSNSTLKFITQAVHDPDVLAIKITLYRTGMNSDVVAALKRAAENGKLVTAFVELKARFDEEKNIIWAKELEHAGAHVVYGVPGLKTHCKIAMVVRREQGKLKTYLHLSTGNYNQITARLYTDVGLFTANDEFGKDATHLFNYLTAYSYHKDWNHLILAPVDMKRKILYFIDREIEKHSEDNPSFIFAKMNSIAHREVIPALYRASQAGVKIQLLVRGITCLKPGIPGISENIEIRSVIGRFLEHSRIFYFKNGGDEEFYISSADWMSRNLNRRVESMIPIYEQSLRSQLWQILNIYWQDNCKSWVLNTDGTYTKRTPGDGEKPFTAQEYFLGQAKQSKLF